LDDSGNIKHPAAIYAIKPIKLAVLKYQGLKAFPAGKGSLIDAFGAGRCGPA
jgi:hypothetical protein